MLTVLRGMLTVVLVVLFSVDLANKFLAILVVFLFASTTDFVDGYLARRYKWETKFGKVFDSMLDKVLILTTMLMLVQYNLVPTWVWALLLIRELSIDSIKSFCNSEGKTVSPRWSGKLKMVAEVGLISAVLMQLISGNEIWVTATNWLAGASLGLAYYSGYFYVKGFLKKT